MRKKIYYTALTFGIIAFGLFYIGFAGNSFAQNTNNSTLIPLPIVDIKVDGSDGTIIRTAPASYSLTWTSSYAEYCAASGTWGGTRPISGSHSFTGVTVLGLKTYTLTCSNSIGQTSDTVYVDIVAPETSSAPPAITDVRVVNIMGSGAQVKWLTDSPSDSRVFYGTAPGHYSFSSNHRCDDGGNVTAHCVNLSGLAPATVYYYVVESKNSAGLNARSNEFTFLSAGDSTPPASPTNLRPDPLPTTSAIYLRWNDSSDNEDKFNIERSSAGANSWHLLASLGANATSYTDTSFIVGTSYDYRVQACRSGAGCSGYAYVYGLKALETTTLVLAESTLSGTVRDAAGVAVPGAGIFIYSEDLKTSHKYFSDTGGFFSARLPSGSYLLELFPPPGRIDLLKPALRNINLAAGEIRTIELNFGSVAKIITGSVTFFDGRAVGDAEIGAYSSETGQWVRTATGADGRYVLSVSGGLWQVNVRPKDPIAAKWIYTGTPLDVFFSKDALSETKSANFRVNARDGELVIRAVDNSGAVVHDAFVSITQETLDGVASRYHLRTDFQGLAVFFLTPGRYLVHAAVAPERGYLHPKEVEMAIGSGERKTASLVFTKKEEAELVLVSGVTKFEDGSPVSAHVWAWSEKGGSFETRSSANGAFSFRLPRGDIWHFGSAREVNGIDYRSAKISMQAQNAGSVVELVLVKYRTEPIPAAVAVEGAAGEALVAQTADGARMSLPSNAAAVSGSVNIAIKPTVEVPHEPAAKVVGTAYEITIKDNQGNRIRQLAHEAEIILPYDRDHLVKLGITEDSLVPSFYDETVKTWITVQNYVIDKQRKVFVVKINHLTRFALVAAADITPPDPPAGVSASVLGEGRIRISWKNPALDFDHARIYRAEVAGELGKIIVSRTVAETYVDEDVKDGTSYYYTVRAVDRAGNESYNINQVSAKAAGTSARKTSAGSKVFFARELGLNSRGEDVSALQEVLMRENVYPEGLITGFYGPLTARAVSRFQEKYFNEVLAPAGFARGTGYAGPATIKKLNSLSYETAAVVPPGQLLKKAVLRDLHLGISGNDVALIQELLLKEGVYPEGLITGFFGDLTRRAVVLFQEKYASEVLLPLGLNAGTGYVGSGTRKKINELLAE